jgi:hypothetical protein
VDRSLTNEELALADGLLKDRTVTRAELAASLGKSEKGLKSALERYRRRAPGAKPKDIHDVLELPPRPFAVPIARNTVKTDGKAVRAVVIGDRQVPFHDPAAMAVARGIIKDVKPHILLDMGDGLDCWQISDYDSDPHREGTLQDDIDAEKIEMHQLADAAPNAERWRLEGNHEDRWRKMLWRLPGATQQLNKLRVFQQTMTIPYLLGMDESGWRYVPTDKQSRTQVLPKLITIHGHQLQGSTTVEGANARKAIQKYGRSVVVGHHHRACVLARRDHNGQSFGIETGCLCLLDGQPYGVDFNWQQAVTVIEWTKDHKVMAVQQVMIRDGVALWRGTQIDGRIAA